MLAKRGETHGSKWGSQEGKLMRGPYRFHRKRYVIAPLVTLIAAVGLAHAAVGTTPANVHFAPGGTIALPGRGLALTWSPAGDAIASGGHFSDSSAHERYDTRVASVRSMTLTKSFDCHYWWTVSSAWQQNLYLGNIIADGGGDHSVKIWNATRAGSSRCKSPGQFSTSDGGVHALYNINGWVTSLAFSPDGRYLAGASRDRTIRIWQIAPGPNQYQVVKLWYDKSAGNFFSVRWSPDGTRLVTGDHSGRVAEWSFNPAHESWDQATITSFAKLSWSGQPQYFVTHAAQLAGTLLWSETTPKSQVWNARYSPDGTKIAAATSTGVLSVYAARTGAVIYRTHAPGGKGKKRHNAPTTYTYAGLYGLDWSPDGTLIAAGSADKNIYVFSAGNGALYDTLVGSATTVTAVAFSPNSRTLASTAGGPLLSEAYNDVIQGPDDAIHLWSRH
jgi:WD40 repeat protein